MVKNNFFWIGGALWLDFINTEKMANGRRVELLAEPGALLDWLQESGAVPTEVCQKATQWGDDELQTLAEGGRTLRATLRTLCEELAASSHGTSSPAVVEGINAFLRPPVPGLRLEVSDEGRWALLQEWGEVTPTQLLFPIAKAAAETLSAGVSGRLHRCANPNCILWFLDTSKNGQRRWCSMETCGNRHKVLQHHLRKKRE